MTTTAQPTAAAQLSLLLDQLTNYATTIRSEHARGARVGAATFAHLETTDRLLKLLTPRDIGGETSGIAVTIMGVDVYVHDQGQRYAVSVNADDADKPVVAESFDGISWEQPIH